MTRIDFYLLTGDAAGGETAISKDMAVCRLTNKAFLLGHRVYIHTADAAEAQRLDNLLWTFSAGSFIPHAASHDASDDSRDGGRSGPSRPSRSITPSLEGRGSEAPGAVAGAAAENMPVIIGQDAPPEAFNDVLVSLAPQVPECFSRFQRVAEIVGPGDEDKRLARERFRFYRDRGYELQTHNL